MSITKNQLTDVVGRSVIGADGDKIGDVGQIFLDDQTDQPEWVTVRTGMFGTKESFVPIAQAELSGDGLRVPYDKATVKDAPRVDVEEGHLSQEEEAELYRHYGLEYGESRSDTGLPEGTRRDEEVYEREGSGRGTDEAMTRSEERLNVGTERREAGRARLRKYVVTEQQNVTVPVEREEVRVEREPITEANRDEALSGPEISEAEHEVTLHEERPVVEKEAVPVERVKLGKEKTTDQVQVQGEVRKEQIQTEGLDTAVDEEKRR